MTGLNAATVGIIALAAVQLSQKAITDQLTRVLVFLGATAGMLYNASWYFPVLISAGGILTVVSDYRWVQRFLKRIRPHTGAVDQDSEAPVNSLETGEAAPSSSSNLEYSTRLRQSARTSTGNDTTTLEDNEERIVPTSMNLGSFTWKSGIFVIACFFITFTIIMVLRGVLAGQPRGFHLFANLYLAGTIIFGGGPVVIPLLREYVVAEGWVSPRDFLLGLAIIQAFPGPNFNFAVYLGSLAANSSTDLNATAGAVIGFIAIFTPGLLLCTGTMGLWKTLRRYRWVTSCLRGVNASAVGLVYTAVYRLWEIGNIDEAYQGGSSLGKDPWWVVITATSFVGGMWFKLSPPVAILLGGAMGMIWYGVVKT